MTYRSPVARYSVLAQGRRGPSPKRSAPSLFARLDWDTVSSVVAEAGRFATDEIAPLNRIGDIDGAPI